MKKSLAMLSAVVLGVGLLASSAEAGTITTNSLPDDETAIVNLGTTVVSAANLGGSTVDINGISHPAASAGNNGDGADLIAELTINSNYDGHYRDNQGYTGDMNTLMAGIAGINPGPVTFAISGLTIGKQYLFQGYHEAGANGDGSITFEGTDSLGGIAASGSLISYTFTAADTELNVEFTGGSTVSWFSGYCLQEVPAAATPGTLIYGK